ncbi:hypothetical protein PTTG_00086 [Puccinia triticina 1-1 BBBD Race 1]|uniref:Peroxin/Ferlin domain-containing protein n=1 Tax=Puccinia triticina (isolate 1-1 / race 1 (BBBD)) TaxID=630390 RepID=A0A180GVY0_PUCT1|nr:hypothetical protein PTTG_00086 [Puccinia triticina 1-1 BBBD Race 1]
MAEPTAPASSVQQLFDHPPQLLQLLVVCAGPLRLLATLCQALSWTHPQGPWPSWILLFAFWLLCHALPALLRYGIPNLLRSLNHLQLIADHYRRLARRLAPAPATATQVITACLTTLPLSVLVGQLVPLRSLLILTGSALIFASSPWFTQLASLLHRAPLILLLEAVTADLFLHLRFQPLLRWTQFINPNHHKSTILASISTSLSNLLSIRNDAHSDGDSSLDQTQEIEFCLTIFENQRWWMGLDWTPNLLPHERANWTDSENQPVSPPGTFKLPGPREYEGVEGGVAVRRRVEWQWVDSEWRMVDPQTAQDFVIDADPAPGGGHSPSLAAPLPDTAEASTSASNPTPPQSPALSLRRARNRSASSHIDSPGTSSTLDAEIVLECLRNAGLGAGLVSGPAPSTSPAWEVDANGWQYGDNHWEKMSKKSGIGRYTRRRAWTRKARLLSATIGPAPAPSPPPASSLPQTPSPETVLSDHPALDSSPAASPSPASSSSIITEPTSTIIQPPPSAASTALSLNLKRSLGLLRRK